MVNVKDRMIIALDYSNPEDAKNIVETLGDTVSFYKVGLELFLNSKGEMVEYLTEKGKKVFLDLKFHDIPNTTTMASLFAARSNVFMFNVHSGGGKKMMASVAKGAKEINKETLAIGVTVLTSFSEEDLKDTYKSELPLKELALNLARLTKEAGMDGVVCSPWEAKSIKEACGEEFKTVCPGVRPRWSVANDQERIMTPKDAILNGCDYLVVGRPVTKNEDPKKAAEMVLGEIEEGLKEKC